MLRIALVLVTSLISWNVYASQTAFQVLSEIQNSHIVKSIHRVGWVVGDVNNYNVDMGFIKGTMAMSVTSISEEGVWIKQDMALGFAGNQVMETLIDPNTGEIKKLLVNGKEEQIPEKPDLEIIEIVDATITVPAGTFDCMHARLSDKANGGEINVWSSADVPLSGMVKTIQPSQIGKVTIELTSFTKI